MKDLFYRDQKQVEQIISKFSNSILKKKDYGKPFFSNYRVFKYKDEISENSFTYKPQHPDDFIKEFATFFENSVNWDNPSVLYNIHPNVNLYGQIASFFANFANPNFAQDISSGKLMLIEKEIVNYFINIAGWDVKNSGGVFTFGGKSTNLYGLKIAIDNMFPNARTVGINNKVKIISNDLGHPCHIEICNWMGIGTENCIRIKTNKNSVTPVDSFKKEFINIIKSDQKLPLIILNGMSTLNHAIDDIKEIAIVRDEIVKEFKLDYTPHIHVDAVIGWVYLLLSRYDFNKNPLNINKEVLAIMHRKYKLISNVKYADSFGADFHKSGFCNYSSSIFMTKRKDLLYSIEDAYYEDDNLEFSKYSPYNFTLELSRSAHGPVSAYATLKTMGVEGFVKTISNITEAFLYLKKVFNEQPHTTVLNFEEESNILFFIFNPYNKMQLKENMDPCTVERIKKFNTDFYQFLIHKLENDEASVFFSCSRSHRYLNQSFGSIKLYSWNSNLNLAEAKIIVKKINDLFNEYIVSNDIAKDYNIFDFLDVKGNANVRKTT